MIDYFGYSLPDKLRVYDQQIAKQLLKCASRLLVQMKSLHSDGMNHLLIIDILSAFKMACANDATNKEADMWFVSHCMKQAAAVTLTSRVPLKSKISEKMLSIIKHIITKHSGCESPSGNVCYRRRNCGSGQRSISLCATNNYAALTACKPWFDKAVTYCSGIR